MIACTSDSTDNIRENSKHENENHDKDSSDNNDENNKNVKDSDYKIDSKNVLRNVPKKFKFIHSVEFKRLNLQYLATADSGDVNRLASFLSHNPYHPEGMNVYKYDIYVYVCVCNYVCVSICVCLCACTFTSVCV